MADDAAVPAGQVMDTKPQAEPESDVLEPADEVSDTEPDEAASEPVEEAAAPAPGKAPTSPVKVALIAGLVAVLALSGLIGWLGFRAYQAHEAEQQRNLFLQVGRQGATNLTTIDFERVDQDVQRILDSATGSFYDEFQRRAQPFSEVVKQVKSKSVGNVTEAGIESDSVTPTQAQVLVAVTVNTTVAGQPEQAPRAWRMRILVQDVGAGQAKVANVDFVS